MLKAEIGGKEGYIQFEGNCLRAVADSTCIIRNLYNHFFCTNQLMADVFKSLVKGCICDDSSPVWQTTGEQGGGWNQARIYPISQGLLGQGGMTRAV